MENAMRPNAVKRALKAGQPAIGTWLSLGSITASRFMARSGLHWLTVARPRQRRHGRDRADGQ
jgi:2-keto-3-deoxy-L-rhamnonate aldolase RhmA